MLTIFLQRKSSSIPTKEACPPVITAASPVTSDPNVHSSRLPRRRFRGSCQQKLHQALYLRRHIKLHGIRRSLFLPIRVANQRRTNQSATRESHRSPTATMVEGLLSLMQGMLMRMTDMDRPANHFHGSSRYGSTMMRPFTLWGGVDSPSKGEVSPCLGFWFLNLSACQVCHVISYSCLAFCLRNHLFYPLIILRNFCIYFFGDDS
jgi:hypothetical protein